MEQEIIPLRTKNDPPPSGAPIYDDESSYYDYFVELPHAESEGDLFKDVEPAAPQSPLPFESPTIAPKGASVPPNTSPEGANTSPERDNSRNPVWKRDKKYPLKRLKLNISLNALTCGRQHQPPMDKKLSQKRKRLNYKRYRIQLKDERNMTVNSMHLDDSIPTVKELLDIPISKFITLAANDCGYSGTSEYLIVNCVHKLFLKTKAAASAEDNPNWRQAMNGKFADEYLEAAVTEVETLEFMKSWEVVEQQDDMNVFMPTWELKLKCYPDGLIKRFKARFCARGDMQTKGVDLFETYAPVVQWKTVRLMLILEVLLGINYKQENVTAAFLHANLGEEE